MSDNRDMVPINMRDPFWKDPFFSSTWDEFDQMRTEMMNETKSLWSKVDHEFKNFDESVKKQHEEMDRQMAPFRPQLPHWAIPEGAKDRWAPMLSNGDDQVIKSKSDDSKFEIALDVSQYKPEELRVTTVNNTISVEGKHEENASEGSFGSAVVRQFSRKWTLPPECKPDTVVSNLSSDGILMITAPKISNVVTVEQKKAIKN